MPSPSRDKPGPIGDDLEPLPPRDGDDEDAHDGTEPPAELVDVADDDGDPLDDATGEGDPVEPIEVDGQEGGWLDGATEAHDVDVGGHDFGDESDALLRDVDEPGVGEEDFGLDDSQVRLDDAGEEGFANDDEDLREEDLPRMDADAEHTDDEEIARFWDGGEGEVPLPPWDDRAWERVVAVPDAGTVRAIVVDGADVVAHGVEARRIALDSALAPSLGPVAPTAPADRGAPSPSELVATSGGVFSLRAGRVYREKGERWHAVEGIAGATAITHFDGGLVVAIYSPREDRAWLVRLADDDGAARVVAELGGDGDDEGPTVLCMAWDAGRGIVWAGGAFGAIAFRPQRRQR
jgi:hypothetical protein